MCGRGGKITYRYDRDAVETTTVVDTTFSSGKRIDSHAPDTVEEVTVEEIGEAREASQWDTSGNRGVLEYDPNNVEAPEPEDVAPSDTDPSWWTSFVASASDYANSLYGQKTADAVGGFLDYLGRSTEQVIYGVAVQRSFA